jgi:CheY-like chemotaxis protein
VRLAEDGYKALELLEKERFDLVLMDIRMPGIDGYETTRRVRQLENKNAGVPVVALTASVIHADIQRCREATMNGYVPKPVSREGLAHAIREQLHVSEADNYRMETGSGKNFLDNLAEKPAWADTLAEICNGRKERFLNYLGLFISETVKEIEKWKELAETGEHEVLAQSLHKIKPHLKIFSGERAWNLADKLEEKIRQGWDQQYLVTLDELRAAILKAQQESQQLSEGLNK